MVGILLSFWDGLLSGAMLVSGSVNAIYFPSFFANKLSSGTWWKKNGAWNAPSLSGCLESVILQGGPPTSHKWSYNPYKWPYKWVSGVITPTCTGRSYNCIYNWVFGPTLYGLELIFLIKQRGVRWISMGFHLVGVKAINCALNQASAIILERFGVYNYWKEKLHSNPSHPWDWYIYLHENRKNQPFIVGKYTIP